MRTEDTLTGSGAPLVRLLGKVFVDARAAIVAVVVVGAPVIAKWVVKGSVNVPAWALVAGGAAVLVALTVLDLLRHRARARVAHLEGALTEARLSKSEAEAARRVSPAAEELLRSIAALRGTIQRRTMPFAMPEYEGVTRDEQVRFERLMGRVRAYLSPIPRDLDETLTKIEEDSPTVGGYLSALDEVVSEVRTMGIRDKSDGPAPPAGGPFVVRDP